MIQDFLCFDTESAQGRYNGSFTEELLELSMMDTSMTELFYSRFKPTRLKRWSKSVHKITPEMVADQPDINEKRQEIQRLVDRAKYIVGFSLTDDYDAMSKAGISGFDKKTTIELRRMYWYCIGRHRGDSFYAGPGLNVCAKELGIDVDSAKVHSAQGDTIVTLLLFFALLKLFVKREYSGNVMPSPDSDEFIDLVKSFLKKIDIAKIDYDRIVARGYIHIVKKDSAGYRIIPSIDEVYQQDGETILTIKVNARKRAAYELEKQFEGHRILNTKNFNLTQADLNVISCYNNEFDNREQYYVKLLGLQRAQVGVQNHILKVRRKMQNIQKAAAARKKKQK